MDKGDKISFATSDSSEKRLALAMFIAGILVWFLIDSDKPLARDLLKGIAFFLFGFGIISLNKWKRWSEMTKREKNMRMIFYLIMAVLALAVVLWLFLSR
jgi:hypothetical protein